ncbi:MAG: hypothetical protein JST73_10690 [Actinobacteria bacterium]|nr:hypothetical protein [Actinomycetota bacterium]
MTARRAYDTPQNRVLVSALDAIRQAAREANPRGDEWGGDERILAAAANAESARRHLEHRALRDVSRRRPSRRDYASTMTGRRARTYVPAIRVLDRVADPLGVDDLLPYTDPRTAWQHWIVVTLGSRLRARRSAVGPWRVTADGELRAGPLAYRHPATAARVAGSLHGIFTSDLLIDVPDPLGAPDLDTAHAKLAARSQGRTALLVTSMNDIERAVELLSGGSPDLP